MRLSSSLLALLPLVGLLELGAHFYFSGRAPSFADYAALAPVLLKQKQPAVPVVVAPRWAEPLVRQAAPAAFPLVELARPDDSAFERFVEVSLLGGSAPELARFPIEREQAVGPFRLRWRKNPQPEPVLFDFVTAVDLGEVEVFAKLDDTLTPCPFAPRAHTDTGGLHGHVAYPKQRFVCPGGRSVGATLIDDENYRARRCILAQAPVSGSVVLRFSAVPQSRRLVGFRGLSYFLERDETTSAADITLRESEATLGRYATIGAEGFRRFDVPRPAPGSLVEVEVSTLKPGADVCFALEAR